VPRPVLLVLALAACSSSMKVRSGADPHFDFAAVKSYGWLPSPDSGDPRIHDERLEQRVTAAVDKDLQAKGYRLVTEGADFMVRYHAVLQERTTVERLNATFDYNGVWTPEFTPAMGQGEAYTRPYTQGTLVLDILDTRSHRLVWRASAQTEVDLRRAGSEKGARVVREAVDAMLQTFPPGGKAQGKEAW